MTEATLHPLSGLWKPTSPKALHYGPDCVKKHLISSLPSESSKAFIVTGSSLTSKTPLISQVQELLGKVRHAGTFSTIKQHVPVAQIDEATELVVKDPSIDTIISVGGGSPIDTAKAISFRLNERSNKFLQHMAIPTTLSAAECTAFAGYTKEDGTKAGLGGPQCAISVIFYDPTFAKYTPQHLWLSTGLRALDHSIELLYHPTATEVPCKSMALFAAGELFKNLPKSKADPKDEDTITRLLLAAFASLGFIGLDVERGLGLSHTIGYALGSPYRIPHGVTSCLSLGHVVKLKAQGRKEDAAELARVLPFIGKSRTGEDVKDATAVGDAILDLVKDLGLATDLNKLNVGKDQARIIVKRATGGQESGQLYDSVMELVKGLW